MRGIRICASLFLSLLFFTGVAVKAQAQKQDNFCQPTIKEILFTINPVRGWNPTFEGIFFTGELKVATVLNASEESLSLSKGIAMVGGFYRTAQQPIYIIRQLADKTRIKIEVDYTKIRKGEAEDINLKKGDIVLASRGCVNGMLLPTTKPALPIPQREPRGVDAPIKFRMPIY